MTRTVDLVISGDGRDARAAAVDVLRRGGRVLIVLRSGDARQAQRLRRRVRKTAAADSGHLTVIANAEVVCVDGVEAVEAVVVRHAPPSRLSAVNARAFVSFDARRSRDLGSAGRKRAALRLGAQLRLALPMTGM
jgi:thioredoxin reductase